MNDSRLPPAAPILDTDLSDMLYQGSLFLGSAAEKIDHLTRNALIARPAAELVAVRQYIGAALRNCEEAERYLAALRKRIAQEGDGGADRPLLAEVEEHL